MTRVEWPDGTAALLDEILTDAYGDDEQLWSFRQAFEEHVRLPADAFVIGEPIVVVEVEYDGNARRGLTARCRRPDGGEHTVAVSDVSFAEGTLGASYVAAYRKWLGLEPGQLVARASASRPKRHKAAEADLDLSTPVELVVLAPKERAARCRILGTGRELTLRTASVWDLVPGEVVTVRGRKQWRYAGHPYLSGDVDGHRLDVPALGLPPLRLEAEGRWDPAREYWGDEGEPQQEWVRAVVAGGPRPSFKMEQVLPGADPEEWDSAPILEASQLAAAGDIAGAETHLVEMLAVDLRCLDAHAHLGNLAFERWPARALRHYEVGVRVGELSFPDGLDGVLPWGRVGNRPFLRCLHGFGPSLWRLGRVDETAAVFERLLSLNPGDDQGVRFLLPEVRAGEPWEDRNELGARR